MRKKITLLIYFAISVLCLKAQDIFIVGKIDSVSISSLEKTVQFFSNKYKRKSLIIHHLYSTDSLFNFDTKNTNNDLLYSIWSKSRLTQTPKENSADCIRILSYIQSKIDSKTAIKVFDESQKCDVVSNLSFYQFISNLDNSTKKRSKIAILLKFNTKVIVPEKKYIKPILPKILEPDELSNLVDVRQVGGVPQYKFVLSNNTNIDSLSLIKLIILDSTGMDLTISAPVYLDEKNIDIFKSNNSTCVFFTFNKLFLRTRANCHLINEKFTCYLEYRDNNKIYQTQRIKIYFPDINLKNNYTIANDCD